MYNEEDFIQLSALQHFIFCERQCALIHIEQVWDENVFTAEGRVMHEHTHETGMDNRRGVRIERGIRLRSYELGLSGKADVVELHREGDAWIPFPVEYKRGKPKQDDSDKVQLCAQALCLEEMLNVHISDGALFYGRTRRRLTVCFDETLRSKTKYAAHRLHIFIQEGKTPQSVYTPKCKSCSLIDTCMPRAIERGYPVKDYLREALNE